MSLPGSSPNRLGANFNPIHANILEQQNATADATAANAQQGKDPVPGLCWYHCNFRALATKCEHGCQYTPN